MKKDFETINFKWDLTGSTYKLALETGKYSNNGRLFIDILDMNEKESFTDLTINIPTYIFETDNEIIINNDCPSELVDLLEKMEILEDTYKLAISGYSVYHIERFNYEKAKKYICYEVE